MLTSAVPASDPPLPPEKTTRWPTGFFPIDNRLVDQFFPGLKSVSMLKVLLTLSRMANARHQCWPTIRYLSDRAGCDRSTVSRALLQLTKRGYIARDHANHHARSTLYTVQSWCPVGLSAAAECSDEHPTERTGATGSALRNGAGRTDAVQTILSNQTKRRRSNKRPIFDPSAISWNRQTGFHVSEICAADLRLSFPQLDLEAQLREAHAWLCANPTPATRKNWARFITNWLLRSLAHGRVFQRTAVGNSRPTPRWTGRNPRDLALRL